jgi:hypothetical protein
MKAWDKAYASFGHDDADKNLHLVGILLNEKAAAIRKQLKMTFSERFSATTKVRAFVALVNQDLLTLQRKTNAARVDLISSKSVVFVPEIAGVRINLTGGQSLSPDEIIQSLVDGVQISLKVVLGLNQSLAGNPRFKELVWSDVAFDFNLGSFYHQIEELWDDCLWNEYQCSELEHGKRFTPRSPFWQQLNAASRARQQNLAIEFFGRCRAAKAELLVWGKQNFLHQSNVASIERENKRQTIRFSALVEPTELSLTLLAACTYASEPYYSELLRQPQAKLGGASLNELMGAWSVVVQCTALLAAKVGIKDEGARDVTPDGLEGLAPVLQRQALRRAVHESVGVDFKRSGDLVDFLTYRGLPGQELWAQPLVPVSDHALAPIFAAAQHADLLRLVDVWLRQLSVEMGVRGPAFEAHVREELMDQINSSHLLRHSRVLDNEFVLRPKDDRDEEIDILLVIDDLIVVGEAKCSVPPTDAKAYAIHRKLVEGAVAQVSRKAAAVEKHRELFRRRLAEMGIEIPEKFKVLPVVILNAAFHAGMAVNGVPVVDLYVFSVFFRGRLVEAARGEEMAPILERVLYSSAEEAVNKVEEILQSPPQMEIFAKGIREIDHRIPSIAPSDWCGEYQTFDCLVDTSRLVSKISENENS